MKLINVRTCNSRKYTNKEEHIGVSGVCGVRVCCVCARVWAVYVWVVCVCGVLPVELLMASDQHKNNNETET